MKGSSSTQKAGHPNQGAAACPNWKQKLLREAALLSAYLLLFFAVAFGLLAFVVLTPSGTQFAWRTAQTLYGGFLQGRISGTLANGLELADFKWLGEKTRVSIDYLNVRGSWKTQPWALQIDQLRIKQIILRSNTTPQRSNKQQEHFSFRVPLPIQLESLQIEKLVFKQGRWVARASQIAARLALSRQQLDFELKKATTPLGQLRLDGQIIPTYPYRTQLDAQLKGLAPFAQEHLDVTISGSAPLLFLTAKASGQYLSGSALAQWMPTSANPLRRVKLDLRHFNPQAFISGAPQADLDIQADLSALPVSENQAAPLKPYVKGPFSLINHQAGKWTQGALPVQTLSADIQLAGVRQNFSHIRLKTFNASLLTGEGDLNSKKGTGHFDFNVHALDLQLFQPWLRKTAMEGKIVFDLEPSNHRAHTTLHDPQKQLAIVGRLGLTAKGTEATVSLSSASGTAELEAKLKDDQHLTYQLGLKAENWDPFQFLKPQKISMQNAQHSDRWIRAKLNGALSAQGQLVNPSFQADYQLEKSTYAGLPLTGKGKLHFTQGALAPSQASFRVADNQIELSGTFGQADSRLMFDIHAPKLDQIGFDLHGQAKLKGFVQGSFNSSAIKAHYEAQHLRFGPRYQAKNLSGEIQFYTQLNAPLLLKLHAEQLTFAQWQLDTVDTLVKGTRKQHHVLVQVAGRDQLTPIRINFSAQGSEQKTGPHFLWRAKILEAFYRYKNRAALLKPTQIEVGPQTIKLTDTQIQLGQALLQLNQLEYSAEQLRSAGSFKGLEVQQLCAWLQHECSPNLKSDLSLEATWDLALGANTRGYFRVNRQSGEILSEGGLGLVPWGLKQLQAQINFKQNLAQLQLDAAATQLGELHTQLNVPLSPKDLHFTQRSIIDRQGKMYGQLKLDLPKLSKTAELFEQNIKLDGWLSGHLEVGGTPDQPFLNGAIKGQNLGVALLRDGLALKEGSIHIALKNNLLKIVQFDFASPKGTLHADGAISLDQPSAHKIRIAAEQLTVLNTPAQQLTISGQLDARRNQPFGLLISGKIDIDKAYFALLKNTQPHFDDDVVILDQRTPQARSVRPQTDAKFSSLNRWVQTEITINLGSHSSFQGSGADLKLGGQLKLSTLPDKGPQALGEIQVLPPSNYETFGRRLNVEEGYLSFGGPLSDPNIYLIAMRRNQKVAAGVLVSGKLKALQTTLISEPQQPPSEALSWLLFGHGTDDNRISRGEQNTFNAALALLSISRGKNLVSPIGLDELSVGSSDTLMGDTQFIRLTKALGEKLSLHYEKGLTATDNLFKVTWQLSSKWEVAAHTGKADEVSTNGVEFVFHYSFD